MLKNKKTIKRTKKNAREIKKNEISGVQKIKNGSTGSKIVENEVGLRVKSMGLGQSESGSYDPDMMVRMMKAHGKAKGWCTLDSGRV